MNKNPFVPVSWGELLDKITILEIKRQRIGSAAARENVLRELALLTKAAGDVSRPDGVASLVGELQAVNAELWDIEDELRELEARQDFGPRFVALARLVYITNDRRAAVKREINLLLASDLIEEKSYASAA